MSIAIAPRDAPDDTFSLPIHLIDAHYLDVIGATLRDGRTFDEAELDAVIVNEQLALRLWNRRDVAGEILPLGQPGAANAPRWDVIGVVTDIAFSHPAEEVEPMAFRIGAAPLTLDALLVRSACQHWSCRRRSAV